MAAAADIGANGSSYEGNAGLGGGNFGVVNIDTKPLQNLADYTYHYEKNVWEQNKKENDQKIKELADLSDISLNDLVGKDKEQGTKEFATLMQHAREYARKTPANDQERIQNELDWQTAYGAFKNNYGSGKTRAVQYHKGINDIAGSTDSPELKAIKLKDLQTRFDTTDIGTPVDDMQKFTLEAPQLPTAPTSTEETLKQGGDANYKTSVTYMDPEAAQNITWATSNGLLKTFKSKTLPDGSPNPEYDLQQQEQATSEGQAQAWAKMAEPINAIVQSHFKDGVFDEDGFRKDMKGNAVTAPIMKAIDDMKAYALNKEVQKKAGFFTDELGDKFALPSGIASKDFTKMIVDYSKGRITPADLVLAGTYANYGGDKITKVPTETGKANQLRIAREGNASSERIAKLSRENSLAIAKLPYEQAKIGTGTGADGKPIDYGNIITQVRSTPGKKIDIVVSPGSKASTQLNAVSISNGVVLNSKGEVVDYTGDVRVPADFIDDEIITEYNKYAGTPKTITKDFGDGTPPVTTTTNTNPTKLLLDHGRYVLRMVKGRVEGIQTENPDVPGGKGSFASREEFSHITTVRAQDKKTKYNAADPALGQPPEEAPESLSEGDYYIKYGKFRPKK